ncbi:MAG: caspase family protein [Methylocella sp.]
MVEGKPSFDCRKAKSDTAQTICGSSDLISLDVRLATLYWARIAKLKGLGAEEEKRRQHDWGVARNQCGTDTACLEQSYQRRIAEFGGKVEVAAAPPAATLLVLAQRPPVQQAQQPQAESKREGPIATVQQLPNPIRLIGHADQPCDVASATLNRLRKTLSVSVPDGPAVQAESLRTFTWKVSGAPPLGPAYLVLAAEAPVRVQGTGFYALTPEAKAPFRIKQFFKDTRVIIPLHVKGAPQSGEVKIRPLIAAPLKVSVAIIGYTQCGENPDPSPIAFDLNVEPGAPEIVIADRYDLQKPDQIIASPEGTRRLEIYGPRYRLIDTETGAQLADEVGKEPRFSPTGRFVIGFKESAYAILDAVDGKFIQSIDNKTIDNADDDYIAWDDRDTFIIDGTIGLWGAVFLTSTLKENGEDLLSWGTCSHVSDSLIDDKFKLDLENNVLGASCVFDAGDGTSTHVKSLTLPLSRDDKPDEGPDFTRTIMSTSFTVPNNWEMIDGLKLTHLPKFGIADAKQFVIALKTITLKRGDSDIASVDPLRSASRSLETSLPSAGSSRAEQRLRDFNVEIGHGTSAMKTTALKLVKPIKMPDKSKFVKSYSLIEDQTIEINTGLSGTGGCEYEPRKQGAGGIVYMVDEMGLMQFVTSRTKLTLINSSCEQGTARYKYPQAYLHDTRAPGRLFDLTAELAEIGLIATSCKHHFYSCDVEAELFFDRYLVVWSRESQAAAIYDVEERKLLHQLEGLPSSDVMQQLSLAQDLKTLLKLDKDGGFQLIALTPAERDKDSHVTEASTKVNVLLFGRIVDDEVVVWAPSGQFDSTTEGASHVALRFPGRGGEYTLEQFHKQFHVDNLLKRALAGEEFRAPRVTDFPPAIAVKPNFSADTIAAKIQVSGDDPVEQVRVYQDGLMTNAIKVAGDAKIVDVSAKRLPGARWVAFLARGPSGLYSQPATFDAGPGATPRRRVHIVSVGIDHYDDEKIQQLHFAGSDAARFAKSLQDKAGTSVEIVSQSLLLDGSASREAILAKLKETVSKADPGDSIILFIAGHGIQTPDKNYYLATSATRKDDIPNTSLPWTELSDTLAKAHTRIAVFLDTCQSGAAGTDFFATNDASVSALLDRAPSGILIFSASKGREESEESPGQGGGVFTTAVIAALSDPKTDHNHNGVIEASELYATVKRAVVEATEGRQTPWFARNDMVGDFVPF